MSEPLADRAPSTADVTTDASADITADATAGDAVEAPGRLLFRYVTVEEWRDYRAIMSVFAGTSFAEFAPDQVATRLAAASHDTGGHDAGLDVVAARLEQLRVWGNLTVSSSVGNPSSLQDYYRRRNRYLITPAAQEVHDVIEGVLVRVDDVRDVSTGRLHAIRTALAALVELDPERATPEELADAVRAVFDPMAAFTSEITQFFAAINQWQSRYDLTPDEFRFFAEVLVGYVADRLSEVERTSRPIGSTLARLSGRVEVISTRMSTGIAQRVASAGLSASVSVSHVPGSSVEDWAHLRSWFVRSGASPSRIERLTGDAVAAIRTLTQNLTRLSREGVGATSRRADFLRLAALFEHSGAEDGPSADTIAAAALGLYPARHYGVVADDVDDPVSPSVPWSQAPPAMVPISMRERGDRANRGSASPIRDRRTERLLLLQRREEQRRAQQRVDNELLELGALDGATLSDAALGRLQELVARGVRVLGLADERRSIPAVHEEGLIRCHVARTPGESLRVATGEGTLAFHDLTVRLERVAAGSADDVGTAVDSSTPVTDADTEVTAGTPVTADAEVTADTA